MLLPKMKGYVIVTSIGDKIHTMKVMNIWKQWTGWRSKWWWWVRQIYPWYNRYILKAHNNIFYEMDTMHCNIVNAIFKLIDLIDDYRICNCLILKLRFIYHYSRKKILKTIKNTGELIVHIIAIRAWNVFKKKKGKKVLTFEVNIWFCCKRPAYYTKSRFIGFYYYRAFQCKSVKKSIYRKWFQTIYVFVTTIQVWCTHINKAHKTKKLEIYLWNLRSFIPESSMRNY